MDEILDEALLAAKPARGLTWLDVGCGRGHLLRRIKEEWQPAALWGLDPIDWLEDDLREEVEFRQVGAEQAEDLPVFDRVMMIEVIEHLEAPWTTLRAQPGPPAQPARARRPGAVHLVQTGQRSPHIAGASSCHQQDPR